MSRAAKGEVTGGTVTALVLVGLLVASTGWVAAWDEGEVTLDEVAGPTLLFATAAPGRYAVAPVQESEVEITVRGLLAEAEVRQAFTNPGEGWVEGIYVFPLPTEAAVHGLRLVVGERIIEGRIEERAAAKKVYEKAKREGKKASLVEQERANIFTTSVANIGPGETVEVEIRYQQVLRFDEASVELRFPTVVGPRYIPGAPLSETASGTGWAFDTDQVEDASRVTPPVVAPGETVNPLRIAVSLEAGFPLASLVCPYHPADIAKLGGGLHRVTVDGAAADRDFVLRWSPEASAVPRAAVFTEELDGGYYVVAMMVPPGLDHASAARLPRETVFVIDTSGSMGGASIRQAREALIAALDRLHADDTFNIIEFDSGYTKLFDDSRPAMPAAVEEGRQWVRRLEADGGTEMMAPLLEALADRSRATPLRQVVFITDGCVGNEDQLFAAIERELGRTRLFTVGIGSAPNSHFMERAASFGRGTFTYIGSPAEVQPGMAALFEKIDTPVLADIELVWPDPDAEVWPERVPDLYSGEPVVVTARLGTLHGDLRLSGVSADRRWQQELALSVGARRAGVNRLWARRKIAALMDEGVRGRPEPEVRAKVLEVALAHSLVSKYTSLVAVDVTPSRPSDAGLDSAAVPTNLPAGWSHDKVFGGQLPRGGTAAPVHGTVGGLLLLLALGLWVWGRR